LKNKNVGLLVNDPVGDIFDWGQRKSETEDDFWEKVEDAATQLYQGLSHSPFYY
jgi:hypothetical protein